MTTLTERLGRGPDARLLIVRCEGLGFSHATNEGVYSALRGGAGSCASLMVPAPWARGAAAAYRGEDVGVLLTLNAEHDAWRWGPLTHAPSLLDGDGGFPRTLADVWEHADLDEVRRECRAQIERAIYWGFDVSHIDSHLFSMQLRPEFFDVFVDLALDFALPVRLPAPEAERLAGFPYRSLAGEHGLIFPDHLHGPTPALDADWLDDLACGVTEVTFRPALDSPELRAIAPDWSERVQGHEALTVEGGLRAAARAAGVELVGFRTLRQLAQRERPPSRGS